MFTQKYEFESFLNIYDLEDLLKLKRGIVSHFTEAKNAEGKRLTEDWTETFVIYNKFLKAINDELFDESDSTGFPKAQKYFKDLYPKEKELQEPVKRLVIDLLNDNIQNTMINMGIPNIIEQESARLAWSKVMFTNATPTSSLNHAEREIKEIRDNIEKGLCDPVEYADAIMCLLDSAGRSHISLIEIIKAMRDKHEINLRRQWVENPDSSYSHSNHISNADLRAFEGRM